MPLLRRDPSSRSRNAGGTAGSLRAHSISAASKLMSTPRPSSYRERAVLLVASLAMFLNTMAVLNVAMPVEQASARTLALIVLATFALLGALALVLPRKGYHPRKCACKPSING